MTVIKILELVGESKTSFTDAVENVVQEAARRIPNITGVEVCNFTGSVDNGKIVDYKANVKVAFVEEQS
ncbi:MAG: dodecin domain-containing protein [Firmicutes bacterium]|nr:dodecin domain-containing protein [Bacillota bacterium]